MKIVITGGAGFIGSAVVRHFISATNATVINVDKLTYAGNLESLAEARHHPRHVFEQIDICDMQKLEELFYHYEPDAVMHLAAETHVDRSIDGPKAFIETNIVGTANMLEVAHGYWSKRKGDAGSAFRFHHISTDEVYGELQATDPAFTEETPYAPNSPYAASKASSDHLVRAWHRTYGLPVLITNCSNNYGPYQFPEKLIPLMILNALEGKPLPVYGSGDNVRDWLYVEDHAQALRLVLEQGEPGETYNIGGHTEKTNMEVVRTLCALLDVKAPDLPRGISSYEELITHVKDRPGHDRRYAIDAGKLTQKLGWKPKETFESGLAKTVDWYLANSDWCRRVQKDKGGRQRLGLGRGD